MAEAKPLGHSPTSPPLTEPAVRRFHEFLQFSLNLLREIRQVPSIYQASFYQICVKGWRGMKWESELQKQHLHFLGCLPPSPPIHAGPFRLPRYTLIGRKTASAFLFPRAPLCRAGVSAGCCRAREGGSVHAACGHPSRLSELWRQEVQGRVTNPDTNPQRLDNTYMIGTAI